MLEARLFQRDVAGVLGVSQSTVARMWKQFRTDGNFGHRHSGGRERITTQRSDRFLDVQARRQRFVTATALQNHLQNAKITCRIRRHFHANNRKTVLILVELA